ncbi:MAG: hypothetical protein NC176_09215 [Treponema brennaborense]|nr:hypothetical protein [Prevotella sp.]MCM1408638.1 hypothetical protein [Treponema brennaborense]
MRTKDAVFTERLAAVDAAIAQKDVVSALSALDALAPKAYGSFNKLGIVRRYLLLGRNDRAEQFLQKSLKKLPDNSDLAAVYVWLAADNALAAHKSGNAEKALACIGKAENYEKCLAGTKYEPLLAELALLKTACIQKTLSDSADVPAAETLFFSRALIPQYVSAASATAGRIFLRNAAVLYAASGKYDQAYKLCERYIPSFASRDDALFCALLAYDSGHYSACVSFIEQAGLFSDTETGLLAADAYNMLGEKEQAGELWQMMALLPEQSKPSLLLNAALYARETHRYENLRFFLEKLVSLYPDFVPGLVHYSRFVLEQSREMPENSFMKAMRASGLKTAEPHNPEKQNRIPVADAVHRFEQALDISDSAELRVEYLKFLWIINNADAQQKIIDIWKLLESNLSDAKESADSSYFVRYAVFLFLCGQKTDDAEKILADYFESAYGTADLDVLCDRLSVWEAEYSAFIGLKHKDYERAVRLYEHAAEKSFGMPAALNLADLYLVLGQTDRALEKYRDIAGRTEDILLKSEIYYRIAALFAGTGDKKNAALAAQYSISLDPSNTKARLLQSEMKMPIQ